MRDGLTRLASSYGKAPPPFLAGPRSDPRGMKHFRTKPAHRARSRWLKLALALVVAGLIGSLLSFSLYFLLVALAAFIVGWAAAWAVDARLVAHYRMDDQGLVLTAGPHSVTVPLYELIDASIMDGASARGYIRQWLMEHPPSATSISRAERDHLRFCTLHVEATGTQPMVPGRSGQQRSSKDLVLLRTRTLGPLLLSPLYNRELRDAVHEVVRQRAEVRADDRLASNGG